MLFGKIPYNQVELTKMAKGKVTERKQQIKKVFEDYFAQQTHL